VNQIGSAIARLLETEAPDMSSETIRMTFLKPSVNLHQKRVIIFLDINM